MSPMGLCVVLGFPQVLRRIRKQSAGGEEGNSGLVSLYQVLSKASEYVAVYFSYTLMHGETLGDCLHWTIIATRL